MYGAGTGETPLPLKEFAALLIRQVSETTYAKIISGALSLLHTIEADEKAIARKEIRELEPISKTFCSGKFRNKTLREAKARAIKKIRDHEIYKDRGIWIVIPREQFHNDAEILRLPGNGSPITSTYRY